MAVKEQSSLPVAAEVSIPPSPQYLWSPPLALHEDRPDELYVARLNVDEARLALSGVMGEINGVVRVPFLRHRTPRLHQEGSSVFGRPRVKGYAITFAAASIPNAGYDSYEQAKKAAYDSDGWLDTDRRQLMTLLDDKDIQAATKDVASDRPDSRRREHEAAEDAADDLFTAGLHYLAYYSAAQGSLKRRKAMAPLVYPAAFTATTIGFGAAYEGLALAATHDTMPPKLALGLGVLSTLALSATAVRFGGEKAFRFDVIHKAMARGATKGAEEQLLVGRRDDATKSMDARDQRGEYVHLIDFVPVDPLVRRELQIDIEPPAILPKALSWEQVKEVRARRHFLRHQLPARIVGGLVAGGLSLGACAGVRSVFGGDGQSPQPANSPTARVYPRPATGPNSLEGDPRVLPPVLPSPNQEPEVTGVDESCSPAEAATATALQAAASEDQDHDWGMAVAGYAKDTQSVPLPPKRFRPTDPACFEEATEVAADPVWRRYRLNFDQSGRAIVPLATGVEHVRDYRQDGITMKIQRKGSSLIFTSKPDATGQLPESSDVIIRATG